MSLPRKGEKPYFPDVNKSSLREVSKFLQSFGMQTNGLGFYPSLKCKQYLKTLGMKRDYCLSCCDNAGPTGCKYMKTIVWGSDGEILFIY